MSFDVEVLMVGSARSRAHAIEAAVSHLAEIGVRRIGQLLGGARGGVDMDDERRWADTVNRWPWVTVDLPGFHVQFEDAGGGAVRATAGIGAHSLESLFADGRKHDPEFYAPVLQIARALRASAGIGVYDWELEEFRPNTERQIERAVRKALETGDDPGRLCFLRQDLSPPERSGYFVMTERPEGYWLLEQKRFLKALSVE